MSTSQLPTVRNSSDSAGAGRPKRLSGMVVVLVSDDTAVIQEFANLLAQKGADIALICRRLSGRTLHGIREQVRDIGQRFLLLDAQDRQAQPAEETMKTISRRLGRVDVLIDLSAREKTVGRKSAEERWDAAYGDWDLPHAFFAELLHTTAE
jgi:NADP-dependent 3-hydroxy acid dehydrogenase YdfG